MTRVSMLSMHTSPISRLGSGDGGGMSVYLYELSNALAKLGASVDIYTAASDRYGTQVQTFRSGLRLHHVDLGVDLHDKSQLVELSEVFTDKVAEQITASGGTDVLHAHYWLSGISGHALKHRLKIPLVSTFHTLGKVKSLTGVMKEPEQRIESELATIGCSDAVFASTPVESAELQHLYYLDQSKIQTVTPGVDRRLFFQGDKSQARKKLGMQTDRPTVLFVGRIQKIKGLEVAIETLLLLRKQVPNVLMQVIGEPSGEDGDETFAWAQRTVEHAGVSRHIEFLRAQEPAIVADYLRAADACIVPSYSESFGFVALEAAACGTPVVSSATGGLRVVVDHGRTGFLVDPGDAQGFADALSQVLNNPHDALALGAAGAERSKNFTWEKMAQTTLGIYEDLCVETLVRETEESLGLCQSA